MNDKKYIPPHVYVTFSWAPVTYACWGVPPLTYRLRMVSSYGRGGLNKCNMQAGGTCYICLPPPHLV